MLRYRCFYVALSSTLDSSPDAVSEKQSSQNLIGKDALAVSRFVDIIQGDESVI